VIVAFQTMHAPIAEMPMPDRADVVKKAASEVGYLDNKGYDEPNKFSTYLGYPGEAWCADFVTAIYKMCGLPLPSMQVGHRTGYSYVPDGWAYAVHHGATRSSWDAQPGDIVCFDWSRRCAAGTQTHTGLVADWAGGTLHTIEGNSAPDGGVNRHEWPAPQGQGNSEICGVIDASTLVQFTAAGAGAAGPAPTPAPAEHPPPFPGRTLMLKSPPLTGVDVQTWQAQMTHRGWHLDSADAYDACSREVCLQFQQQKGLPATGGVDAQTWAAAWADPVTPD
jgi:hypothetical protein